MKLRPALRSLALITAVITQTTRAQVSLIDIPGPLFSNAAQFSGLARIGSDLYSIEERGHHLIQISPGSKTAEDLGELPLPAGLSEPAEIEGTALSAKPPHRENTHFFTGKTRYRSIDLQSFTILT